MAAAARRLIFPLVPRRKRLPLMYWLNRFGGWSEAELVHLAKIAGSSGIALDIGANNGGYTYPLSKLFSRVYAFEINEDVTDWIRAYDADNIEIIHCGLSSAAGTARFYIPVLNGVTLDGWGSLDRANLQEADGHREKDVGLARLDDFGIRGIGFIKIDVEGHEVEVLQGAIETIRECRPTVLIEVRERNLALVDAWFRDLEYRRRRLEDLVGVPGEPENFIYVPNERLAGFHR
jgi:FkbM family methyltransferase